MGKNSSRYCYDLKKPHVIKDMFTWKFFWQTYGIKQTLIFILKDTTEKIMK